MAQDHLGGNVRHRHGSGLGQERHRTGRTGIHLDHIHIVVAVCNKLDIVKAHNADGRTQFNGIINNLVLDRLADGECGVDADRVAGMYAGALHMLHNTGNEHICTVTDGVHLQLFTHNVFIHQHRLIGVDLHSRLQVVAQALLIGNDLHGTTTQYKGGAHQHRITDGGGNAHALFNIRDRQALRLGNALLFHYLFKAVPVLCPVNGSHIGADDGHTQCVQRRRQVNGGLTAKGHHNAHGLLQLDHIHHIFHRQRLKIQLV